MARPSKLTDAQWGEVLRLAAQGETVAALAARFKVDKGTISRRVSQQVKNVKTLAGRIAEDEQALEAMPISQRIATRTLADRLKATSESYAEVAEIGARNGLKMARLAEEVLEDAAGEGPARSVAAAKAIHEAVNTAVVPAVALIRENKSQPTDSSDDAVIAQVRSRRAALALKKEA